MDELDFVDEALIDADRATVYAATGDLARGKAQWWPGVEIRPRGEIGPDLVGGVFDMIVRRLPGRSTLRIVEVRENEMIRYEYVDGPTRGVGTLTLTPVDGQTRASYRYQVRPRARLLRLVPRVHRRVHQRFMRIYFEGLRRYVERERPAPAGS
jgi:Polyketide cyclase / dehydrase and lipid transport